MNHTEFMEKAKELVVNYTNSHTDESGGNEPLIGFDNVFVVWNKRPIDIDNVYVVWSSKVLQNSKALLSTTLSDGMYYEVTLNGDKNEIYFDAYKKFQNIKVEV